MRLAIPLVRRKPPCGSNAGIMRAWEDLLVSGNNPILGVNVREPFHLTQTGYGKVPAVQVRDPFSFNRPRHWLHRPEGLTFLNDLKFFLKLTHVYPMQGSSLRSVAFPVDPQFFCFRCFVPVRGHFSDRRQCCD